MTTKTHKLMPIEPTRSILYPIYGELATDELFAAASKEYKEMLEAVPDVQEAQVDIEALIKKLEGMRKDEENCGPGMLSVGRVRGYNQALEDIIKRLR